MRFCGSLSDSDVVGVRSVGGPEGDGDFKSKVSVTVWVNRYENPRVGNGSQILISSCPAYLWVGGLSRE